MKYAVAALRVAACLALLSAGPAFAQTNPDEAISNTSAAPVAYVYLQTIHGVNAYDVAPSGKLALVKGSPFKTSGAMIGGTGKYFITLGTFWVHSYAIESDGAIGEQISQINTLDYDGAECQATDEGGNVGTNGAVLDPTGQNLYVFMFDKIEQGQCVAYQTFNIDKSTGKLTFNTVAEIDTPAYQPAGQLTISGNNKFAWSIIYNWAESETPYPMLEGFKRESNGALVGMASGETDPKAKPGWDYDPIIANDGATAVGSMAADPSDHLAVIVTAFNPTTWATGPTQLASYTVDGEGNIASTNTWKNMPTLSSSGVISNSGKLLAISGSYGIELLHFNGADPITPYRTIGTGVAMGGIQWDNNNHMYATGTPGLYVYTVTPASVVEAPGSPYSIPGVGAFIVYSK